VTLLAAGHETTAGALGWSLERLSRHLEVLARVRAGDDEYLDAVVKEVLRVRPVLSIVARKTLVEYEVGGWTLPPGVHVTPCIYLTHRRPDLWDDPTAFRPERFLNGAPEPYAFIPFGGGTRRCLGAAFATLEMREVLRAVAQRFALAPDRAEGERMRRRSITLTPARGGYVVPEPLASSPRHADVLPPQSPDRELPDLQPRAAG
jgi:cytochrome P450